MAFCRFNTMTFINSVSVKRIYALRVGPNRKEGRRSTVSPSTNRPTVKIKCACNNGKFGCCLQVNSFPTMKSGSREGILKCVKLDKKFVR
jgi:hypothetical protein